VQTEVTFGSQHIEAIRMFRLDKNRMVLQSLATLHTSFWLPGEIQVAKCNIHREAHPQPQFGCTCGLWSCKSRAGLIKSYPLLVQVPDIKPYGDIFTARVEIWGVVIEHEWGYRSEFARIIPQSIQAWPRYHAAPMRKCVNNLRNKYAVQ
jgi:hypothetical protein